MLFAVRRLSIVSWQSKRILSNMIYLQSSAVSAGEPLNREVVETFGEAFSLEVRDGYGQTENTLLVGTMLGHGARLGSMGKPTPGNRVEIIDEDGNPASIGEVGDIAVHISTPALFKEYLNDPERTSMQFRGDYYVTGDRAKMDEDGYFWFEGRGDDIIISSGYTIGPFEVEEALLQHKAIKECAVVASPDEVRGTVRSQRLGEAADQCVVHLTDELRLRLRQSMKRTVGHEDSAVLGARLVAVACEDFYGEVQCRADGTRKVVTDCRVAEVPPVGARQAM